ncbi:nuclear transport factor 2 family protein, partial [Undibacterium luofuense]|uniref:nuclear transport factor 2 family protein n=1 Tax=Undibacterium luofuense TaxID=2828733 RepID=UPI0030EBCB44
MKKIPLMILLSAAGISLSPFALADGGKPAAPLTATTSANAGKAEKAIHAMLDQWHNDAARADRAYFDKLTENAVFIGTDPDERWTRAEFIKWSEPFFQRGKAWTFHVRQRH